MRLLVVEDDPAIADFVVKGLIEAGFAVDRAASGSEGLELASAAPYDAAVVAVDRARRGAARDAGCDDPAGERDLAKSLSLEKVGGALVSSVGER